jgi:signal transduction histidine kinase
VANVSHELRTPLQTLIGYGELLMTDGFGALTDQQAEVIATIQDASLCLGDLVEDLLRFSQATVDNLPIQLAPMSLERAVRRAVGQTIERASSRQIALDTYLPAGLPDVQADDEKITWVIGQFLDNAIKFTPNGGRVQIRTEPGRDVVGVAVKDNGIGIPDDRIDEAFIPFHQLDGSITRRHNGTGLGLALARSIVEAHGSRIEVRSKPGGGSRFAFALPIAN